MACVHVLMLTYLDRSVLPKSRDLLEQIVSGSSSMVRQAMGPCSVETSLRTPDLRIKSQRLRGARWIKIGACRLGGGLVIAQDSGNRAIASALANTLARL